MQFSTLIAGLALTMPILTLAHSEKHAHLHDRRADTPKPEEVKWKPTSDHIACPKGSLAQYKVVDNLGSVLACCDKSYPYGLSTHQSASNTLQCYDVDEGAILGGHDRYIYGMAELGQTCKGRWNVCKDHERACCPP